jgi:hypothetical protein
MVRKLLMEQGLLQFYSLVILTNLSALSIFELHRALIPLIAAYIYKKKKAEFSLLTFSTLPP